MITRIAPSPTGYLHLWTVRTALYSYILAKKYSWKFILRIEDTDLTRSTKFFEEDIMNWLKWLWLDRDEWPYYQMQRLEIYKKYADFLIEKWAAYYAWETQDELERLRQESEKKKKPFIYRQINYTEKQLEQFRKEWRKPVVRFKVKPEKIRWIDLVKWEIEFDMSNVWDFVILKSDWIPTFYFANVIDDALMWVTHVLRWEDHISNTPKQIQLYNVLNFDIPVFWHFPLILNQDKTKMSKRDNSLTISSLKEQWFLPQAIINFVLFLWRKWETEYEFFNFDHLMKDYFELDYINILDHFNERNFNEANATLDINKLYWYNWQYIKSLKDVYFVSFLKDYLLTYGWNRRRQILSLTDESYLYKLAPFIKVRLLTFSQFKDYCDYFFVEKPVSKELLFNKNMWVDDNVIKYINDIIKILEKIENWEIDVLKEYIWNFIKNNNLKNWQILWPIRVIMTWAEASPGAYEMMYILWKDESIKRLKDFLETV